MNGKTQIKTGLIFEDVGIWNGQYGRYLYDKDGKRSKFEGYGRAVYLDSVNKIIETGEVLLKLSFEFGGVTNTITIPRDHLKRQELLKYASNGVDVFEHTVSALIKLLQAQENETEEYYYNHKFLGWDRFNGKDIFKSSLIDNSVLYSEYCGDYLINPTGSYDIWRSMIESEVIGNPGLELALAMGFSAVLVGLSNSFIDGENLFIHLFGESSTGKTTAAHLIASIGGSPDIKGDGLLRSWHLTFNALIKTLLNNYGYPIVFDEFGAYTGNNIDNLVYLLATGREKDRMNKDLGLNKSEGFRTTIISTGERSILEQCSSELKGLDTRLIELSNLQYTISAKQAERIKKICFENYGHALPKFAEFVSKISVDTIYSDLSKCKQRFINAISAQENYFQRLCGKYSLIFITAKYANKAFSFGFDLDKIFNLLVKIARDNLAFRSANNTDNAYNLLVDYVIKNKANFVVYDKRRHFDIAPDAHLLGAIKDLRDDNYQNEVIFYLDAFKSIIKNLNLGGERKVLQNLKKKGVLIHDNHRLTTKRTVISGAEPIWTYVIKMNVSSSNKIGVSPHVVELDCSVDDLSELG